MLMAIESFVGVLFGSITGAIIFGKIARIQSIAHVQFSYPICVRYGTGVIVPKCTEQACKNSIIFNDDDSDIVSGDEEENVQFPCPVLEFRMINEMSRESGGEIMDAKVNVVASTLAQNEEDKMSSRSTWSETLNSNNTKSLFVPGAGMVVDATKMVGNATIQAATCTGTAIRGVTTSTAKAATSTGAALLGVGIRAGTATGNIIQKWNRTIMSTPRHGDMITQAIENDPLSVFPDDEEPASRSSLSIDEDELKRTIQLEFEKKYEEKIKEVTKELRASIPASVTVDEGNSNLAPPKVYHKLEVRYFLL
jgi:hypothetical protein